MRPLQVLIVENHPDTVKWLQYHLEDLGHTVDSASTLAEGKAKLEAGDWDLLISDIGLPDGAGWNLLEGGTAKPGLFAVAMSGFGMNADSARSRSAGFRRHLLKPFKIGELGEILRDAAEGLEAGR